MDVKLIESAENLGSGYAGGINAGQPFAEPCDAVLILNPDLALAPDTVTRLLAAAKPDRIGAVVPLMLGADGDTSFPCAESRRSLVRSATLSSAARSAGGPGSCHTPMLGPGVTSKCTKWTGRRERHC